jgi:hypothetical protein
VAAPTQPLRTAVSPAHRRKTFSRSGAV